MQLAAAAAAARASWADLPAELLEIIYEGLANCREIIGFRSVCRRWRLSTPPPPNKISGMFPLRPSFLDEPSPSGRFDFVINASAVYLVRPHPAADDPSSKAWMVALHEASAGKLVLRHPLTYKVIFNSGLDVDRIAATQTPIARSYGHNQLCMRCNQVAGARKVGFVRESSQLVGLCEYGPRVDLFAFRIELSDDKNTMASQLHPDFHLDAIGTFNGRVFAVDYDGRIYLLNNTSLELIHLNSVPRPDNTFLYFLVSDGGLYLVSVTVAYENRPPACQIYRLRVVADPNNSHKIRLLVEKVDDLGDDRVFFTGMTCAFAVSARRDLPPPWKGNCVVFGGVPITSCVCNARCDFMPTTDVFVLGGGQNPQCIPITSFQGYSDLFPPPAAAGAANDS